MRTKEQIQSDIDALKKKWTDGDIKEPDEFTSKMQELTNEMSGIDTEEAIQKNAMQTEVTIAFSAAREKAKAVSIEIHGEKNGALAGNIDAVMGYLPTIWGAELGRDARLARLQDPALLAEDLTKIKTDYYGVEATPPKKDDPAAGKDKKEVKGRDGDKNAVKKADPDPASGDGTGGGDEMNKPTQEAIERIMSGDTEDTRDWENTIGRLEESGQMARVEEGAASGGGFQPIDPMVK